VGGALVLEDRPSPTPRAGEVLIDVAAAGVTIADIMQRRGTYPGPAPATDIPGLEVAGLVSQLGEGVRDWKVGDRVCAICIGGGYADRTAVAASHCLPVPPHWKLSDAAATVGPLCTAWFNVILLGRLAAGETLLVQGGSGGLGSCAVQLFSGLGHRVYATAGGPDRCWKVEQLGAIRCFDYRREDFGSELLRETSGDGFDMVLDILGAGALDQNLAVLKEGGRLMGIATQMGSQATLDLWTLYRKKLSLSGSTLRSQSEATKSHIVASLRSEVWPMLERLGLRSVIDSTWPLEDARKAQDRVEQGGAFGKVLLEVNASACFFS